MKDFKTKAIEDYGNIIVNVKEATIPVILQLYQGDKEIKVLEERTIKGDGKVVFDYLGRGNLYDPGYSRPEREREMGHG